MHPILANRERLALYMGAGIPGGGLLAALVAVGSGMPWQQAAALTLPLGLVYSFVCLAAWYPCQSMPPGRTGMLQLFSAHGLTAAISSSLWLAIGLAWAMLLDRLPFFEDTLESFRGMLVLFFVIGMLLYLLAVVVHYLLIAFEASRDAESRNLELEVQAREAELRAVRAQQDQKLAERELELARSIQRRLLPPATIQGSGYRVAARNVPARFVAGDFYDVFRLANGTLGLVVADVAGKGIGASLITASVKAMTPLIAADHSVTETLRELNSKLVDELAPREFVALSIALYDTTSGRLELANSGLPDPYILRDSGPTPVEVPGPRLPLGVRADVPYESRTLKLEAGERLLLLTDGLPEAPTESGDPLGYEALQSLLDNGGPGLEPMQWLDELLQQVRERTTETAQDDLTALLLQRV